MVALKDEILHILRGNPGLDDDELADRLKRDRHQVNAVCRQLVSEGLVIRGEGRKGKIVNRLVSSIPLSDELRESSTAIEVAPATSISFTSPSIAQAIKLAKEFELHAKAVLSVRWGVSLAARDVPLTDAPNPKVKFDLVSEDFAIVGDAKFLKNIQTPAAKWSVIAEYVWLLQHVKKATRRFIVFGQDREVANRWLDRYQPLTGGIEFYFLEGENLINLQEGRETRL